MDLVQHYDSMWQNAVHRLRQGDVEQDPLIDDPTDSRRGLTLLARPSKHIQKQVRAFLDDLAPWTHGHYVQPATDLHLTLLSIISCYSGFQLDQVDQAAYVDVVDRLKESLKPVTIHFKGITASPSCVLVCGYPEDGALEELRNKVRLAFRGSSLEQSMDKRYHLQTAHMTVLRFRSSVTDPNGFTNKLLEWRDKDFGCCRFDHMELVCNDWYQRAENTVLLREFELA